ncbi:MAG: Z1 domain-containing protein [Pseudomonadota bacterium]
MSTSDVASPTDWAALVGDIGTDQYDKRIAELNSLAKDTTSIEETVGKTIDNLKRAEGRSFVIFGEPQSGKTEMMIALTAKLLDEGADVIVHLLTDSLDLLAQSLQRFRASGINPSPKQYSELPKDARTLRGKKWVIFSKKNARDLVKLIDLLRHQKRLVVIDDEADYASPNAKVNKDEKTRINELICALLGNDGQYIGVTATPARLNLNNTFENDAELWVDFRPHPAYVGQDFFFPTDGSVDYRLHTFEIDEGSERKELQTAIMHFLCGVAELHQNGRRESYTMLVHTSGKRDEHREDVKIIQDTLAVLSNSAHPGFQKAANSLAKVATEYTTSAHYDMMKFILGNIGKNSIVEINSNKDSGEVATIAKPTSLFSFGAGGNIISRGVTFDNLLSLYFTRAVKGKFSQDTYIQRARMFGARKDYKEHFQLWIPEPLMANWSKCFEFHKLALEAMRSGAGLPVWLADHKTTPTSPASIDRSSVDFEGGEMSFGLFDFDAQVHGAAMQRNGRTNLQMLEDMASLFEDRNFPSYIQRYLMLDIREHKNDVSFHKPSLFGTKSSTYSDEEKSTVRRKKGAFSTNEYGRSERPNARHHLKIYYNDEGKARLFYKINGQAIKFMQNRK